MSYRGRGDCVRGWTCHVGRHATGRMCILRRPQHLPGFEWTADDGLSILPMRLCGCDLLGSRRRLLRAAPADEVGRCEECRRILVRTAESGL